MNMETMTLLMAIIAILFVCLAILLILVWQMRARYRRRIESLSLPKTAIDNQDAIEAPPAQKTVQWSEVQSLLPDTFEILPRIPLSSSLVRVEAPFAQAALHGLAGAAPSLLMAMKGDQYFKIIGPPGVLEQNLLFLHDRTGRMLGDFIGEDGKIVSKARFQPAGNDLSAAATAACVFQVLSVATAQYYLHSITESLQNIQERLDEIEAKLEGQQHGKVLGAMSVMSEIYTHNLKMIDRTGDIDWGMPTEAEFWSRMATAETGLREVIHGVEYEVKGKLQKWISSVSMIDPAGNRVRITETVGTRSDIIEEQIELYAREFNIYRMALFAMMRWYQVVLSYDARSNFSRLSNRYNGLVAFLGDRLAFLNHFFGENNDFIFVPTGESWKDIAVASIPVYGLYRVYRDEKRMSRLAERLEPLYSAHWKSLVPLKDFYDSLSTPTEFHLRLEKGRGKPRLALFAHPNPESEPCNG